MPKDSDDSRHSGCGRARRGESTEVDPETENEVEAKEEEE
jgi:hypothetical protein